MKAMPNIALSAREYFIPSSNVIVAQH